MNSAAFCKGFARGDAKDSFSNLIKGNTLFWMAFWMAFKDGLVDKQYVRPPPNSPICGCAELVPKVSHTDCVEAEENYMLMVAK